MNHLCKFYCYLAYVNTFHVFQVGYDAASIIIRDTKNVLFNLVLKDKICKYNNCEKKSRLHKPKMESFSHNIST